MAEKHFWEQQRHTRNYLLPYLDRHLPGWRRMKILEVGCAEGGLLAVLADLGVEAEGLELMPQRVALAQKLSPGLKIQVGDITRQEDLRKLSAPFHLIILRDVIEHIENRPALFTNLRNLLADNGFLYITFPPRLSPFAGHQQNGRTILRKMPYFHLLPNPLTTAAGKILGEYPHLIAAVQLNRRIGLTIRKFEQFCDMFRFRPIVKELFLSRPGHHTRLGWRIRRFPDVPILREFLATGCEVLLQKMTWE